MIIAIRIKGIPGMPNDMEETLQRLRLGRKYTAVLLRDNKETIGMIRKVENFIAYGKIEEKTLLELVKARGKALDNKGKIDAEKIVKELLEGKTEKKLLELGLKPFFRLHPPRKGINSKIHFPKGVLGNNKEKINDLIRRML